MSYGALQISSAEGGQDGGPGPASFANSPRLRRSSFASTIRLVPHARPDEVTRLINDTFAQLPTNAALQVTDLSVQALVLDAPEEPPDSFRRQTLLTLDCLKGLLLALHADESIQLFLRADQEPDEMWYAKQTRWTESPLYALRLLAVSVLGGKL